MSDSPERDQRHCSRVEPENCETTVRLEYGEPFTVSVLDESFGGIGVFGRIYVDVGEEVETDCNGVQVWAIVRHASPIKDGYRLGLEWKAEGFARKLRNTIEQAAWDGIFLNSFLRMLPGGLSMMWKLFERGRWTQLSVFLERMRREAALCGVDGLTDSAMRVQSEIDAALDEVTNELMRNGDVALSHLRSKVDSTINASKTLDLRRRVHESLTSLVDECLNMTVDAVKHRSSGITRRS